MKMIVYINKQYTALSLGGYQEAFEFAIMIFFFSFSFINQPRLAKPLGFHDFRELNVASPPRGG